MQSCPFELPLYPPGVTTESFGQLRKSKSLILDLSLAFPSDYASFLQLLFGYCSCLWVL